MSNIVFLDTETGGTDPNTDSLLSLAAVIVDTDYNEIRRFETFIRQPGYTVSGEALRKNKIDISGDDTWPEAAAVKQAFVQFLGKPLSVLDGVKDENNRWVIYGKNPEFDVRFLKAFFGDHVYNSLFMYYSRDVSETFMVLVDEGIYQRPKHLTLQDLCVVLGVEHDAQALHNAMYDTQMTLKCAQRMQVQIKNVRNLVQQVRARNLARRGPIA